jgi:hypothetical protein
MVLDPDIHFDIMRKPFRVAAALLAILFAGFGATVVSIGNTNGRSMSPATTMIVAGVLALSALLALVATRGRS